MFFGYLQDNAPCETCQINPINYEPGSSVFCLLYINTIKRVMWLVKQTELMIPQNWHEFIIDLVFYWCKRFVQDWVQTQCSHGTLCDAFFVLISIYISFWPILTHKVLTPYHSKLPYWLSKWHKANKCWPTLHINIHICNPKD